MINCQDFAKEQRKLIVFVLKLSMFSFLEIIREIEAKKLRKRKFWYYTVLIFPFFLTVISRLQSGSPYHMFSFTVLYTTQHLGISGPVEAYISQMSPGFLPIFI